MLSFDSLPPSEKDNPMGMFDWVNHKANCTECGEALDNFQSKDGPCDSQLLEVSEVNVFYTACTACETWYNFQVLREDGQITVKTILGWRNMPR